MDPVLKSPVLSPFEIMERLMFMGIAVYVGLVLCIFFLKRGLAWLDDRYLITYSGHVPTYGTLANAFLELQGLAQPEKQYVIEMKEDEKQKKELHDVGGSDAPSRRMEESTPPSSVGRTLPLIQKRKVKPHSRQQRQTAKRDIDPTGRHKNIRPTG